ncbi:ALDH-like protein [Lojkania enalia]|uniref:ALDH-like protein n=1 Tax=Lojkania enalia TaxID=147567 RepID=A0A9P4JYK6_9PLEO|nr:ALDH-like protein [Didymosphaeria enalia]
MRHCGVVYGARKRALLLMKAQLTRDVRSSTFDAFSLILSDICWNTVAASRKDTIKAVESSYEAFKILLKAAAVLEANAEEFTSVVQSLVLPLAVQKLKDPARRCLNIIEFVLTVQQEYQSSVVYKGLYGLMLVGQLKRVVDVLSYLPSEATSILETMIQHSTMRKINFSGSVAVGTKSGQICMATDRITVESSIAEKFTNTLREVDPPLPRVVSNAVEKGAKVLFGGSGTETLPETPIILTILHGVKKTADIRDEESFGLVVALNTVSSEEGAVKLANGSQYELYASIFTRIYARVSLLQRSRAVHINNMTIHHETALPFRGIKNSGWGRFNAEHGMEEFLVTKSVT